LRSACLKLPWLHSQRPEVLKAMRNTKERKGKVTVGKSPNRAGATPLFCGKPPKSPLGSLPPSGTKTCAVPFSHGDTKTLDEEHLVIDSCQRWGFGSSTNESGIDHLEVEVYANCIFNSGASLGLHRSSQISSVAPEDSQAHGAQGPDPRMPTWAAMVFSSLGFGRLAAKRCMLFTEGQQGCAATLL
jgi:hypothetical protein